MIPRVVPVLLVLALSTVPTVGSIAGAPVPSSADLIDTRLADSVEDATERSEPRQRVLHAARAAIEAYPASERGLGDATEPMLDTAHANLDTTEAILSTAGEARPSLQRTMGTATEVTEHHARLIGVPTPSQMEEPTPRHEKPSTALADLASVTGTQLTVQQHAELADLDDLPGPVAEALTDLVDAHLATIDTTDQAIARWADVPSPDDPAQAMGALTDRPGGDAAADALGRLLAARSSLLEATIELERALDTQGPIPSADVSVPPAFSIDLGDREDSYTANVTLLVDAGGDDTYQNNAGGNGLGAGCPEVAPRVPDPTKRPPRAAAAVDLDGEDRYISGSDCGVNGGGWFGSGLLIDGAGDDLYRGGDRGTNGGGQGYGLGLLVDSAGQDTYEAGDQGTNGGGDAILATAPGVGVLVDGGGPDTYAAGAEGTNGGGWTFSIGALVDLGGPDTYTAGHFSTNGGGWIGQGFLVDTGGDDRYEAGDGFGTVGVNGGAQSGVGFVYDDAGNDTYTARTGHHLTAENGGAAGGVGMLLDAEGQDRYRANGDGTNGGVQAVGLGVVADGSGDDVYEAAQEGVNGGADASVGALALLADAGGNDTYVAEDRTANGAAGGTGTALLFDRNGVDRYRDGLVDCVDCTVVPKGQTGAQLDR